MPRDHRIGWILRWAMLGLLALLAPGPAVAESGPVVVLEVKGVIGVAATGYIARGIERAAAESASLVVIRLDTPGGLVSSTRDIIQTMLASPVPVAVYVAPVGARAASAGTYIAYAAHIAAMAPGTHLGAATPVSLGGVPGLPDSGEKQRERDKSDKGDGATPGDAMERKVLNDAVAYIRGLAQLHGRNAEWAEQAVRVAATLTAQEAVREHVVDLIAANLDELLAAIDGRTLAIAGVQRTLAVKGARIVSFEPDFRTRVLTAITDPNIAYILMLVGVYGLILEFFNPGSVAPGVIGGIALLTGLAALSVLPVDYAGLALILLGIALMVAETFTPGVIVLGIGGVVAFVAGSLFLFDPSAMGGIDFGVAWPVVGSAAAVSGGLIFFALGFAIRARRRAVVSGAEEMIGIEGRVIDWAGAEGHVRAHGEIWRARADAALQPGDSVRAIARDGLVLVVKADQPRR